MEGVMKRTLLALLLLVTTDAVSAESRYKVVTTIGMITDVVREIAGDKAEVVGMMGAGIDPHLYKPTRTDIAVLNSADIIFYNGLMLEGRMTDALVRVASTGKKVFAITEEFEPEFLLEPEEFQGHYDPHVWMDPSAWAKAARFITVKLKEFDSANANYYEGNYQRYSAQLDQLSKWAERTLSSVPKQSRVLVTAHDAFNYFGRRFGFKVLGIQGISTESEAGVRDIEKLVDTLVSRNVRAVFIESTVSQKNIMALIEGAKARGHEVTIGGELFSDAMGKSDTYEGTYLGMIDHNVTAIAFALGGAVDPKGMGGKLQPVSK